MLSEFSCEDHWTRRTGRSLMEAWSHVVGLTSAIDGAFQRASSLLSDSFKMRSDDPGVLWFPCHVALIQYQGRLYMQHLARVSDEFAAVTKGVVAWKTTNGQLICGSSLYSLLFRLANVLFADVQSELERRQLLERIEHSLRGAWERDDSQWLETTVRKCGGGRPRSAAPRSRLVPPWGGCQLLLLAFGGPA